MSLDINDFIGHDDNREYLNKPFNFLGRTIACNGHVLISMPLDEKHSGIAGTTERMIKIIADITTEVESCKFQPMPVIETPEKLECCRCKGLKTITVKECSECDSDGGSNTRKRIQRVRV